MDPYQYQAYLQAMRRTYAWVNESGPGEPVQDSSGIEYENDYSRRIPRRVVSPVGIREYATADGHEISPMFKSRTSCRHTKDDPFESELGLGDRSTTGYYDHTGRFVKKNVPRRCGECSFTDTVITKESGPDGSQNYHFTSKPQSAFQPPTSSNPALTHDLKTQTIRPQEAAKIWGLRDTTAQYLFVGPSVAINEPVSVPSAVAMTIQEIPDFQAQPHTEATATTSEVKYFQFSGTTDYRSPAPFRFSWEDGFQPKEQEEREPEVSVGSDQTHPLDLSMNANQNQEYHGNGAQGDGHSQQNPGEAERQNIAGTESNAYIWCPWCDRMVSPHRCMAGPVIHDFTYGITKDK